MDDRKDQEEIQKEQQIRLGNEILDQIAEAKTRERDKMEGKSKQRGKGYTRKDKTESKRKKKIRKASRKKNRGK